MAQSQIERSCLAAMYDSNFSYTQRQEWIIYGARHQSCGSCRQPVGKPCVYLTDLRKPGVQPRTCKMPHQSRIDWYRIYEGLKLRGYIEGDGND